MKKLLLLLSFVFLSCEMENIEYRVPFAVTYEVENVHANTARFNGEVWSEGGKEVTEYGTVWSTSPNPTIADHKAAFGERVGSFSEIVEAFEANTKYYYRTYAINEIGTGYGEIGEFTTSAAPTCEPVEENVVDLSTHSLNINYVDAYAGFENVEFITHSYSYSTQIQIKFFEEGGNYPQGGEYTTVAGNLGSGQGLSEGFATLRVQNYGYYSSANAEAGVKFYVENNGEQLTFIFCDTPVGNNFILNGKFSTDIE